MNNGLTGPEEGARRQKPTIRIPGRHGTDFVNTTDFVTAAIPPLPIGATLFRSPDGLSELRGEPGELATRQVSVERLRCLVDDHAVLVRRGRDADEPVPCSAANAKLLLHALADDDSVDQLRSTSTAPMWLPDPDGRPRLAAPGFDAVTGHFYDQPPELISFEPRQLNPRSPGDRQLVHQLITEDIWEHFPWSNEASAANTLAAMLTLITRRIIAGPTPMFAVLGTQNRVGKTLVPRLCMQLTHGKDLPTRSFPTWEHAVRNDILAAVRTGSAAILWDNLPQYQQIDSTSLAQALTTGRLAGRVLRTSTDVECTVHQVVFVSGRSPTFTNELALRTIPIELRYEGGDPERREGLPDLEQVIKQHRVGFLEVAHGMIQAWVDAGCPKGRERPVGGFEAWDRVVGGILELFGLGGDFCGNLQQWRRGANEEREDLRAFLLAWMRHERADEDLCARDLLPIADDAELFPDVLKRNQKAPNKAFARTVLEPLKDQCRRAKDDDGVEYEFRLEVARRDNANTYRLIATPVAGQSDDNGLAESA